MIMLFIMRGISQCFEESGSRFDWVPQVPTAISLKPYSFNTPLILNLISSRPLRRHYYPPPLLLFYLSDIAHQPISLLPPPERFRHPPIIKVCLLLPLFLFR